MASFQSYVFPPCHEAPLRVDPEGPWKTKSLGLALSTLLCEREEWHKAGLYGGEAAIPCLAASLISGAATGPPALDLPDWPATMDAS